MAERIEYTPLRCWAFAWGPQRPSITRITAYTRRELIASAERVLGSPWTKIRRMGGRAIRVVITQEAANG